MIKKISYCLLFLTLLFTLSMNIKAENINSSETGSINGLYVYGDKKIDNVNVHLYKIATIDNQGVYTYEDSFKDYTEDINKISDDKWGEFGADLATYIKNKNIRVTNETRTKNGGSFNFSNLRIGLYLITTDSTTIGDYKYSSSPSLVSVPTLDEINSRYIYDVSMTVKTEAKNIKVLTDNNLINSPKTYDRILIYVGLLIVAIIGITALVIYIRKNKDRSEKNETKNN